MTLDRDGEDGPMRPQRPQRVLLALDDAAAGEDLAQLLGPHLPGWSLERATSSIDAKRIVETRELSGAVIDYDLAGRRGTAILGALRRLQPDCARVLATSDTSEAVLRKAVEEGRVHGILPKPVPDTVAGPMLRRLCTGAPPTPLDYDEALLSQDDDAPGSPRFQAHIPTPLLHQLHAAARGTGLTPDEILTEALETWLTVHRANAEDPRRHRRDHRTFT